MLFALGAISSAVDAFQSLTSSKSKSAPATTGFGQSPTASFDPAATNTTAASAPAAPPNSGGGNCIAPATMSALIAAQGQASGTTTSTSTSTSSASSSLQDLFSQIDGNGDGAISKSEFESALGAGGTNVAQADDVFNKLDSNGDGSVSLDEMSTALKGAGGHGHGGHHHHVASSDGSGNADGSSGSGGTGRALIRFWLRLMPPPRSPTVTDR